ncbi:hypothetical protein [Sphingomonas sp. NFR15]|uniref:hypothetical protein n=1 Tax=Sphingomonas sp. NFR15 TaxID=1566282 RepID=UPI000881F6EF|nr:hypothetical protein [Sphingomonas sp. NFR15]SDA35962.1 hypothetical protein SAMN03159340_03463 [Sphingomonas sp. NFR15]
MNGMVLKFNPVAFRHEAPEPGVMTSAHDAKQKVAANLIHAGLIRRRLASGVFDIAHIDAVLSQIMDNCHKAADILGEIQDLASSRA